MSGQELHSKVDHLFRHSAGKMTAVLSHFFGLHQLPLIEDIIQETFYAALKSWPSNFPPEPEAWLIKVAKRNAINLIKRNRNIRDNLMPNYHLKQDAGSLNVTVDALFVDRHINDSQLRLLVACCHPGLSIKNQIVFTLKTLGGFGTTEIASALLMKPEAAKKAYQRAFKWVRENGISLQDQPLNKINPRLESIHKVLYLMFNEGYKAAAGNELVRYELCFEAIRMTRIMVKSNCCNSATKAMLALMYFNASRLESRVGNLGTLVLLEHQNRNLWDQELIKAGFYWLSASANGAEITNYHLESAIASLHCAASEYKLTDWKKLLYYYEKLLMLNNSPVVLLNYLVVFKMNFGPESALRRFEECVKAEKLNKDHLFYAVKGMFEKESGLNQQAAISYSFALNLVKNQKEKEYLQEIYQNISLKNGNY